MFFGASFGLVGSNRLLIDVLQLLLEELERPPNTSENEAATSLKNPVPATTWAETTPICPPTSQPSSCSVVETTMLEARWRIGNENQVCVPYFWLSSTTK